MTALLVAAVVAAPFHVPADCSKTFSGPMIERAVDAAFAGTREVSRSDRRHLRHFIRCRRRFVTRTKLMRHWRTAEAAWRLRRDPPMNGPVLASYYTDGGGGACQIGDVQSGYRFASLFLSCGTVIRMCHGASCVNAMMSDHGPYVGGRTFDLNANLKDALGCGGLCDVTWRSL
jgi:hypothetical protein